MKLRRPVSAGRNHAVEHQRVEVHVQVQRAAEALDHDDRAAAPAVDPHIARAIGQHAKHGADEQAGYLPAQVVIPRQLVPQPKRHAQDPLPNGHSGEDAIDQVCRTLGHAPAAAAPVQAGVMAVMAVADTAKFDLMRQKKRKY
jgi:hypothetical protein